MKPSGPFCHSLERMGCDRLSEAARHVHHLHEDRAEVQVGGEENRKKALHGSFRQALEQIGSGNEIRDLASSVGCFGFWSFTGIAVLR